MPKPLLPGRLFPACVTMLLISHTGCDVSPRIPEQISPEQESLAAATEVELSPHELLERIQQTLQDVEATAALYEAKPLPFRRQHLAQGIRAGLDDADRLATLPDSTPDQQQAARWLKAQLLGYGSHHQIEGCDRELDAYAGQLQHEFAGSDEAEMAEALLLRKTTTSDRAFDEVMQTLRDHTRRFPQGTLGLSLYHDYALRLARENDIAHAIACCREATESYASHPQLETVRLLLVALAQQQASETQYINSQNAHLQDVLNKVGHRRQGYFVIDAHEKKSFGLVGVEYFVCHGVQEVASRVRVLPAGWEWKLHAWFPDTKAGQVAASEAQDKLLKKTVAIPTFEPLNQ